MEPAEISILKALDALQREQVLRLASRTSVPAGTVLFREGDTANTVYLILSGQVGIYKHGPGDGQLELGRPGPGEVVGEIAAIVRQPRSATVRAISDCDLLVLSWPQVEELMLADGRLAVGLLTAVCATVGHRLTVMNERLAQLHLGVLRGLD